MKFKNSLKALIVSAFICSQVVIAQVGSPSTGMATLFERYPVEICTGLPKVSIPLYSMPTHSKDISLDISLNYHQASVRNSGFRSGNCGRGWYLSLGGSIQLLEANKAGFYSFNFMGYSGKLTAIRFTNGNKFTQITDNKGPQLYAETFFSSTGEFQSVNFYDNKGYKYVFNIIDITNVPKPYPEDYIIVAWPTSFQLADVYDPNNNLLMHFNYTVNDDVVNVNGVTKHDTVNTVSSINISGFGSVAMDERLLEDNFGVWHMYGGFVVKDLLNNVIKNVEFEYNDFFDFDKQIYTKNELISAEITGTNLAEPQAYNFSYHPVVEYNEIVNSNINGFDSWGYQNTTSTFCRLNDQVNHLVDKKNVMGGVLEKIKYPTGGCIIYEYESNTYSYNGNTALDAASEGVIPDFYTDNIPENDHNYIKTELVNSLNTNFLSSQVQQVYVKAQGDQIPVILPNGQMGWQYPLFTLINVGTGASTTIVPTDRGNNDCLGRLVTINAGTYRIEKSGGGSTNVEVSVYTRKLATVINKYLYGGGIRIKTIGFFDTEAPQDYFYSGATPTVSPAKTMFYKYNSFANPTMSSGIINSDADLILGSNILYANVSVSDSGTNKRTDYFYLTPLDYQDAYTGASYKYGKLKATKIYNSSNVLQKETAIDYITLPGDTSLAELGEYKMGWMMPSQVLTNEYLGSTLVTKENYEYDTFRNIKKKTVATSRSSESLISNYYYHLNTGGTPFTTNRVSAVDHIDELVGTTPLSTSKIVYSNTWTDTQGNNTSYLPSQMLTGKGAGTPEIKIRNNKYDRYGNILESEQEGGLKKSFIWGYNDTTIIAEISGVAYSSIPIALINAAKTASNSTNPNFNLNETNLLAALTNLRNAPEVSGGLITTYTYKPLVGVSTVTDPRGYKLIYEYDADGRQKAVKDQDGFIISENIYHIKPQN